MECRGCGKTVDQADVCMVAKWPFCPDCFQGLLEKEEAAPATLEAPEPETIAGGPTPEEAAPETVPCHLCQRQKAAGLLKKVGIWMFCPDCYADLAAPAVENTPLDGQAAPEGAVKDTDETDGDVSGEPAGERVDVAHFVNCDGCGRRIPEAGSKVLDGESLCPDCYYAQAREASSAVVESVLPTEPLPPVETSACGPSRGEAAARCQSCDQPGDPSAFAEVEGFRICGACLGADRDLAVRTARSRRLRLLQRMETELS